MALGLRGSEGLLSPPGGRLPRVMVVLVVTLPMIGIWTDHYWAVVMLAVGVIYLLLLVSHWASASRLAVCALLAYPLVSVMPIVGTRYILVVGLLLLVVGLTGLTLSRTSGVCGLPVLAFQAWLLSSALRTLSSADPLPDGPWVLLVVPVAMLGMCLLMQSRLVRLERVFLAGLVVVGVIESVLAISQQLSGSPSFSVVGNPMYEQARNYFSIAIPGVTSMAHMSTGTFEHFNTLGAYMCMVVPIVLWYWLVTRRWTVLVVLAIVVAGLLVTFSRGALGGAACGVVVAYLWSAERRAAVARILVVAASVLAFTVIALPRLAEFWGPTNNLRIRFDLWRTATAGFGSDLFTAVLGQGYGRIQMELAALGNANLRVHSGLVQILVETGVVGLALFTYAVVVSMRRAWGERSGNAGVAGAVIAFLIASSIDNALLSPIGVVWVGLVVILATTGTRPSFAVGLDRPGRLDATRTRRDRGPDREGRWVAE